MILIKFDQRWVVCIFEMNKKMLLHKKKSIIHVDSRGHRAPWQPPSNAIFLDSSMIKLHCDDEHSQREARTSIVPFSR